MNIQSCLCATLAIGGALALSACSERGDEQYTEVLSQPAAGEPGAALGFKVSHETGGDARQGAPGSQRPWVSPAQASQGAPQVVMRPVQDSATGLVAFNIPLPADWQFARRGTPQDPTIVGPDGIKVYQRNGGNFSFPTDPQTQQLYRASGVSMRAPVAAEQIVQQDIAPVLQRTGLRFVRQYRLPQLAAVNEQYDSWLYKVAPSRMSFDVLATEWSAADGTRVLVILNQSVSSGNGMINWSYWLESVEAPGHRFGHASQALIHALSNKQHNPAQIQAYNANEAHQLRQSQGQHNAKMQEQQNHFDAMQKIHRDKVDSVNNSQMSIYRTQRDAGDRMQQGNIDAIRGESTVIDPHQGRQVQVEAGSSHYWMNGDGQYIRSNDSFYNPNRDPALNRQDWRKVQQ